MGEILEELHKLQIVELKLADIRQTHDDKARRLERFRRRAEQADDQAQQHARTVRERQMRIDALSLDIAAREDQINHHRVALTKAKTNKEYAAILSAMNTEKADSSKVETDALQLMEEMQTLKETGEAIDAEKAKHVADAEAAQQALEAYDKQTEEARTALEAKRAGHAEKIPGPIYSMFSRVARRNEGDAMASVEKTHPKRDDYICGGCNMSITLEVVNALQTRDEIQLCGQCGRILYFARATAKK